MFIISALADVVFAVLKGISIVFIGVIYTINEWLHPN